MTTNTVETNVDINLARPLPKSPAARGISGLERGIHLPLFRARQGWAASKRLLFLVGSFLVLLSANGATDLSPWTPIFQGIDHAIGTNSPGGAGFRELQVVHALRVDLQDPDVQLFATPRATNFVVNYRETAGMTVSNYLTTYRLQVAINANNFHVAGGSGSPSYTLPEGTVMDPSGVLISQGLVVSEQEGVDDSGAIMFGTNKEATVVYTNWPARSTAGIFTAVCGLYPVLANGVNIGSNYLSSRDAIHQAQPRTAFGLSQDHRYLFLLTIDGRQSGYSNGALDWETAAWLLLVGAWDGINMDGGGSTTMVMADSTGRPIELNEPSAVKDPATGRERTVGAHLGVYAKPLAGFINDVQALPDDTAATLTWTTVDPSTTQVQYGLTENLGSATDLDPALVANHSALLSGLKPNTGYFFRVFSTVDSHQYGSASFYFKTTNYVTTNSLFEISNVWMYTTNNLDGVNWTTPTYDDSAWPGSGPGLLWADIRGPNAAIPFPMTQMPTSASTGYPYVTYYFRTHFNFTNGLNGVSLLANAYIDDGAVFYLNGLEICRLRMEAAAKTISNATLATGYSGSGDATSPDSILILPEQTTSLVAGDNVLAVEVHNYNARSPDITFGLSLLYTEPYTVSPTLNIGSFNGSITLMWNRGGFSLQQADTPAGPWMDVPGPVASSPFIAPMSDATLFFRLRK